MTDEEYPRPWAVQDWIIPGTKGNSDTPVKAVASADGSSLSVLSAGCFADQEMCLAALVGAVNAADARTPLAEVLAGLAAGKCP